MSTVLVEERHFESPKSLRAAWSIVRDLASDRVGRFDACEVTVSGPAAELASLVKAHPGLVRDRDLLVASDDAVADALAARATKATVTLGLPFAGVDSTWPFRRERAGVFARRIAGEIRLWCVVPWRVEADLVSVDPEFANVIEPLGAPRWSRLYYAPTFAETSPRVPLRFEDELGGPGVRDAAKGFEKALAARGYTRDEDESEPRLRVVAKTSSAGNRLAARLDLGGIAPGPWSPAVEVRVAGIGGFVRAPIAAGAKVTTPATWAQRLERIVEAIADFEGREFDAIERRIGASPVWFATANPEPRFEKLAIGRAVVLG